MTNTKIPNSFKKKVFLWDSLSPEELENIYEDVCRNINYIQYLIDMGIDLNKQDNYGWTLLHEASIYGNKEIAELLIQNGTDINVKDKWGRTPLHIASRWGHKEVAELLIQNGAKTGEELKKQEGNV